MPPPGGGKKKKRTSAMSKTDKSGTAQKCVKAMFSHVGLFLIVVAYAVIGAFILIELERENETMAYEKKKRVALDLLDHKTYMIKKYWFESENNKGKEIFESMARRDLNFYHSFIVDKALNENYDGDVESWDTWWTIPKSVLFTITTMGAIGYGHIYPQTGIGQIFTVYYGMIGVPLLLLFLANIGEVMGNSFRYIYSRLCCRWCRIRRYASDLKKGKPMSNEKSKILWDEDVGTESYMPTALVDVPITVNLCLIGVFLLLGGCLFNFWEGWSMTTSAYFTFITLTTIGFGDYVPGIEFGADTVLVSALKMTATMIFVIIGMALLSMAINLMQEQLIAKVKWCARQLGAKGEETENKDRYKVKRSPEDVQCTPADMTGDKQLQDAMMRKHMEEEMMKRENELLLSNF